MNIPLCWYSHIRIYISPLDSTSNGNLLIVCVIHGYVNTQCIYVGIVVCTPAFVQTRSYTHTHTI